MLSHFHQRGITSQWLAVRWRMLFHALATILGDPGLKRSTNDTGKVTTAAQAGVSTSGAREQPARGVRVTLL